MKIKRKVEKNLPQLIEWAWENLDKVQSESFISNVSDIFGNYSTVHFSVDGYGFRTDGVADSDTFTVEVEEEITEDTFFKHLIKVTEDGEHYSTDSFKIKDLIHLGTEEVHAYIDGEYKLIWTREKGLVE